ncbi:hypothetical protein OR571_11190 [Psychrobacillus sp. NEAU-3TGS]|uniref:hypothetical protein n=1 Tax=Psychrobacillus sp. NEAU-3TGS TaxID=2995412 RepID=UPI002495A8CD|nr:hypothetical protein [Psychrobacillus sp. NEAU-3TGS]MDI2587662.1 hypothetical protein [Psychrobacillus sp. NEAU-3TGS]
MIYLKNNSGFKWIENSGFYFKGYQEDINSNNEPCNFTFNGIPFLIEKMKSAKGFFSIVYENEDIIFAAVDCVRSIPLYYGVKDREFYLSDDARWIRSQVGYSEIDDLSKQNSC